VSTVYFSRDDRRRDVIAGRPDLNGIDFLEVHDSPALPPPERQRTLFVHFINDPTGLVLGPANVRIKGGERIRGVRVTAASVVIDARSGMTRPVLVVAVDQRGDFSTYTLELVEDPGAPDAVAAIDPLLRAVDFSFKVNCPSDFDCATHLVCPPEQRTEPVIDYLARDFNSLRQLMLDRLAVVSPAWKDRSLADLGITLVELLAYVGDQLSYAQDAVATEAYLGTARKRVSARRHARLVDYFMHDGCNARAWLHVRIDPTVGDAVKLSRLDGKGRPVQVLTDVAGQPPLIKPDSSDYGHAIGTGAEVFELMDDVTLWAAHNEMHFYTWGERQSCLPKGAVRASLRGAFPHLEPGDFLLFREMKSPRSGDEDDAEFSHRHVVRLVEVTLREDPIGAQFDDPPAPGPIDVTDIEWAVEDALPFPLCISAERDKAFGAGFVDDVSLAFGNLVLVDHGQTLPEETLDRVPVPISRSSFLKKLKDKESVDGFSIPVARLPAEREDVTDDTSDHEDRPALEFPPVRFQPLLKERPLTQAQPLPLPPKEASLPQAPLVSVSALGAIVLSEPKPVPTEARPPGSVKALTSARKAADSDPHRALPAITLFRTGGSADSPVPWHPRLDLLNSAADALEFVAEIESDGRTLLRFGDGEHGEAVSQGMEFTAVYRIGNGVRGNVGAETLVHLVTSDVRIQSVTNWMPAFGGCEPETIEEARQRAPHAFIEEQMRAVTPADYAAQAARYAGVQRAAGTMRWTGSWHTMFVSVDRLSGKQIDPDFEANLRNHLEPFRMAGVDLEIDRPRPVPLELTLRVRVRPDYFRSSVELALRAIFTSARRSDGGTGLFHPDNFTFGQTVYLSKWLAAAQGVSGVESVEVGTFQRREAPDGSGKDLGFITVGRLEVPVLENNPNFPERGTFQLLMEGGK